MGEHVLTAIIGALVGAMFGGAAATFAGIRPLRTDLEAFKLETVRKLGSLEARVESAYGLARQLSRDYHRRMNRLTVALGHAELAEDEGDDLG